MRKLRAGGGWRAITMSLRYARRAGGILAMFRALRSPNACKTCALGMGGQRGGMVNERGVFPSVCKKSLQAMAADMQGAIRDGFFSRFSLDDLGTLSPRELEASGRLTQPLYAGPNDTHYREMAWEEALAGVVDGLRRTAPDESFFYFSGRSSNEAAFLLQLFARLYGTNNVNNCSYYCHQASGVGLSSVIGSGTATVVLEDLARCDLVFLIGGNPASNHPRLLAELVHLKRRGGKVVVINPARELGLVRFRVPSDLRSLLFGSRIADEYLQPHIGGDIALCAALAKATDEMSAPDARFLNEHTTGGGEFLAHVRSLGWGHLEEASGVSEADIRRVARLYARSRNTIFCWAMGVTHHEHGVQNVQAIANLALLRGMIGRPGAGLLPLRGHSNVQGIGSVGVTPKLKDAIFERLQEHLSVKLPTQKGMDTLACMEAADRGEVRTAICLGGNLYASNPDSAFAARALNRIDQVVYLSTTLNTGHAHGRGKSTWILPVLVRDEESQSTTQESMFNYVRLSSGGPARYRGPRSEVDLVAEIAERYFAGKSPVDWSGFREHKNIRKAIAASIPGYARIADIDEGKAAGEFQIADRTLHQPEFATPDGRARFHVVQVPALKGGPGQLRLMTVRSEGQFNTVVYEDEDVYRHQERRDVILMNEADIRAFGLQIDQPVTVRSDTGVMANILVRAFDIRSGNAMMYYPEANVLIPKSADPSSGTPAFKSVAIIVEPQRETPAAQRLVQLAAR